MTGHNTGAGAREGREIRRGTSNANERGNSEQRRRRREWLVETYPADEPLIRVEYENGDVELTRTPFTLDGVRDAEAWIDMLARMDEQRRANPGARILHTDPPRLLAKRPEAVATCRCARCGKLLTVDTVTCDRIFPGHSGGKYGTPRQDAARLATNVRPHCGPCASLTGAQGPRPNARRKATK